MPDATGDWLSVGGGAWVCQGVQESAPRGGGCVVSCVVEIYDEAGHVEEQGCE